MCICNKYLSPPTTFDEVQERCAVSDKIRPTLEKIAYEPNKWMSVYRCRDCGTHWAEEYPFGEQHGGGPSCFYVIGSNNPETWLETADDLTAEIRRNYEDEMFYKSLGSEIGPEPCKHEECERKRIPLSVMCRCHHFEMVLHKPCPFW